MPETGGSIPQSGILYQNSVAALYLGRLIDSAERPSSQLVVHIRVEAPEHVDDVVVTFADGHKEYIQAKEYIANTGDAWRNVWSSFSQEFQSTSFQRDVDRLVLLIGSLEGTHPSDLRELCQRTSGSAGYNEWIGRLTGGQRLLLLDKISPNLSSELRADESIFRLFHHIEVRTWPLEHIEVDRIPTWIPQSNRLPQELFRLLRDRVGGKARVRGEFTADSLMKSLCDESPDLRLTLPGDIGSLRVAVRRCGALLEQHKYTIANTAIHIKRSVVDEITGWLLQEQVTIDKNVSILLDQAGMGKTVVMRDVLCDLEARGVDVLAIKADQQLSDAASLSDVQNKLGLPYSVEQTVERLAKLGRVVILIDQVDALSLSLAHDQRALNAVLDLVARLRRIPNVRILISCRAFDRNSDPHLKRVEIGQHFALEKLTVEEVKLVLDRFQIDFARLSEATQQLLQVPLHLDLFGLAIQENREITDLIRGISSLQELYDLIWQNVILQRDLGKVPPTDRIEVLYLLTDVMDREKRTSASRSVTLFRPELESAALWLASAGIILQSKTGWTFLHQTFFDYCYARRFVERGGDIVSMVLTSSQGIFERPKLIQVIAYLRSKQPDRYLRDMQRLLADPHLRFHLRDLLIRWFGSLDSPTEGEWVLAQRMLFDPKKRSFLLMAMQGNPKWFVRLQPMLSTWLAQENALSSEELAVYLASLADATQADLVSFLRKYVGRGPQWIEWLYGILSRIRQWRTVEAAELFEQVICSLPSMNEYVMYRAGEVAQAYPVIGCRLVRFLLNVAVEQACQKDKQKTDVSGIAVSFTPSPWSLHEVLHTLESRIDDALPVLSTAESELFAETLITWLEKVLLLRPHLDTDRSSFMWDGIVLDWYDDEGGLTDGQGVLIRSLIVALIRLAKSAPEVFRSFAVRLAHLPYETPQMILARVYQSVPSVYAEDALSYLLADQRRLDLGDGAQYETRQVVRAIYPYLSNQQRDKLEAHILTYAPIHKSRGIEALRWRGIEQFHILKSIPREYLTARGIQQLRQWEHKFPDVMVSERPITSHGGFVGSPISEDIARKMSDTQWLRAMQKYQRGRTHKDFLRGGAEQLSQVLQGLVKENPKRFYRLLQRVPDGVEDAYVSAFVNGLADSVAPADWLFQTVRRFIARDGRAVKRVIARAVQKQCKNQVPEDLLGCLYTWVNEPPDDDEWWWRSGDNHGDVFASYLNSDRGAAFETLMRVFDSQGTDEARAQKWKLIEFAAVDPSSALRVGAIHELTYMIKHDRARAISLFEQLMSGHSVLLESQIVREFLYWAFPKHFLRLCPYLVAMMTHVSGEVQEQGAQLACIAALSTNAMESAEAQTLAQRLAEPCLSGLVAWRRGAAKIYAHNLIDDSTGTCKERILALLADEDQQVQRHIGFVLYHLRPDHIFSLRDFIQAYARSRHHENDHEFAEYLWENGLLDPAWSLSVVRSFLEVESQPDQPPSGSEELIRLVLRIYAEPTADDCLKTQAMDVFDLLMEKHSREAQKILSEWDRR